MKGDIVTTIRYCLSVTKVLSVVFGLIEKIIFGLSDRVSVGEGAIDRVLALQGYQIIFLLIRYQQSN